jgi:hypothetical protein
MFVNRGIQMYAIHVDRVGPDTQATYSGTLSLLAAVSKTFLFTYIIGTIPKGQQLEPERPIVAIRLAQALALSCKAVVFSVDLLGAIHLLEGLLGLFCSMMSSVSWYLSAPTIFTVAV